MRGFCLPIIKYAKILVMKILFWICLLFVLYTYVGYPFFLALSKLIFSKKIRKFDGYFPSVSVVVAVHNEGSNIFNRITDIINQNYHYGKMDIIVVSDGSTDETLEVLNTIRCECLKIIILPDNKGKAAAINAGVEKAKGDLVIFTDSRQTFAFDAIRNLSKIFADPNIGCVSGELVLLQDAVSTIEAAMGAYWKYEKWIRKAESATGSTVGATGAIYAIRKELYRPLPQGTILDDVLVPLNIRMQGYRCLFIQEAVAYDIISKDISQEWKRKVRTLAGNWQLLSLSPKLLLPWRNPIWWRFLSHKIFRLIVPFALGGLLIASMATKGMLYNIASLLQIGFYLIALMGWFYPVTRKQRFVNLCYFFVTMNIAAVVGFWKWVTGRCDIAWQPAYKAVGKC